MRISSLELRRAQQVLVVASNAQARLCLILHLLQRGSRGDHNHSFKRSGAIMRISSNVLA